MFLTSAPLSTLKSRGGIGEEIALHIPERIVPKLGGDLEELHGGMLQYAMHGGFSKRTNDPSRDWGPCWDPLKKSLFRTP